MESNRAIGHNDELATRATRQPDYASENNALVRVAKAQAGTKVDLLQEIAEAALSTCRAGSAGISLVEGIGENRQFRWTAVAGLCGDLRGKTTSWNECPCGVTLDANEPQLFIEPQTAFPCLQCPGVDITEGIVVPIRVGNSHLGAIWVTSHDESKFDREDVRLLSNLSVFAGTSLTIIDARDSGIENDTRHSEFIAMLGHELRNPMAPIDSAIGAAKRLCSDSPKAVEVLTVAQRQVRHLRTLVDDLLEAARLKHGKLAIKYSDTSLNEIAFDALSAVKHHFESRRHTLKVSGLDSPVLVRADHVRLSQVLGNVLSNAAKYTPVGGTIEMTVEVSPARDTREVDGAVVITIRDNGIGIDSRVQPFVFELFAQSARAHARAEGGLGIGLAVAKRMVELHEGTIALQSEGPDKGTVVTLSLPILRMSSNSHLSEPVAGAPTLGPVRLLLVDDNTDALMSLGVLLELEGHHVTTADNGRDGIRLMTEARPEVAIIDVGMPVVDGFEVARAVRSDPKLNDITLVALTGYAAESDKSRALAAGFDYHLTKPLSLEKLHYILVNRTGGKLGGLV